MNDILEEMRKVIIATNAFYNTSFDPDGKIQRFADDFEQTILDIKEKCKQYGLESERFVDKCFRLAIDYLHSESQRASWAVVGPAGFDLSKNTARLKSAMDKLNRYLLFCKNIEKTLKRSVQKTETQDDKKDKWLKQIEELKAKQEMMKTVNAMVRKGEVKEAYALYNLPLEENWLGNYGFESYELRNNLANIKRLEKQVATIDKARKKNQHFDFEGGHVDFDADEIRYNVFFDKKPREEMRKKLKHNGFKWSPTRGAWTRGAKTVGFTTIMNMFN